MLSLSDTEGVGLDFGFSLQELVGSVKSIEGLTNLKAMLITLGKLLINIISFKIL